MADVGGSDNAVGSWRKNLARTGGFFEDARWYELQLQRKLPLAKPMMEETVFALPPVPAGSKVLDVCSGNGALSRLVSKAYPDLNISLVDNKQDRLQIASSTIEGARSTTVHCIEIDPVDTANGGGLAEMKGKFDFIVCSLALHPVVGHSCPEPEKVTRYSGLFKILFDTLVPGGHLVFGDHVGTMGLYQQLRIMEDAGFVEIDCAWRKEAFFVAGGRKPVAQ